MNNPTRGSRVEMVRQDASINPDPRTLHRFLAMIPAAYQSEEHLQVQPREKGGVSSGAVLEDTPPFSLGASVLLGAERPQKAPLSRAEGYSTPPRPVVLPTLPTADEVRAGTRLSRGALRLWTLLHRLALDVVRERAYMAAPVAVAYHLPAVAVALMLEYTERHLYRLADELVRAGLLDGGGHAQNVYGRTLWDGSIWKVATAPGHTPKVTPEEWKYDWRPGFFADYEGKTGAAKEMSGLLAEGASVEEKYRALKTRAAVPDGQNPPVASSPDILGAADLQEIAADLPALVTAHPSKRHALVGGLASRLAAALAEPGRRRQWCKVLYELVQAENEQRPAVAQMRDQLHRLAADLREGAPWRAPGAVLASRLA